MIFKSTAVPSEVAGNMVNFYPPSLPVMFQLKSAASPLAKLLTNVWNRGGHDVVRMTQVSKDERGTDVKVVHESAISTDLAKLRSEQANSGIKDLLDQIFADQNRQLLGRVLMDSLRDDCPRKPTPKQIDEFMEDLDIVILGQMVQGMLRASKEAFRPLERWVKTLIDQLRARSGQESVPSGSPSLVPQEDVLPEVTD